MSKCAAGVDVGGTTVKFGLFSSEGELLEKWNIKTDLSDGGSHIVGEIADSLKEKLSDRKELSLTGIGIGLPGPVDRSGKCLRAVNLTWTEPCDPAGVLTELLGIPCKAANDANAAALGEAWKGAGEGTRDLLFAGLGTGIGCGIVLDGKILTGAHGAAGEMGHMIMDGSASEQCTCGNAGCVERYASANGMVRSAENLLREKGRSVREVYGVEKLSASILFNACRDGNPEAEETVSISCDLLGRTIAAAANLVDPDIIVIGGGVVNAGAVLFDRLIPAYRKCAFPAVKETPIVPAGLGSDAGIYGAARLVL